MKRLDTLVGNITKQLGDDLISMVEFGPTVRGEPAPNGASLLIIVRDASPEALRPIEPAVAAWVNKQRKVAPLIFSEAEWYASTDVFPIEIEEMRDAHRQLHGRDPFVDVTTSRRDLRHQLEREIRGKLLQLRAAFAAAAPNGRDLAQLLGDSITTFMVLFRTTLRLVGERLPSSERDVVHAVARVADLDPHALNWVLEKRGSRRGPKLTAYDPIATTYVATIEGLARFVDQYEQPRSAAIDAEAPAEKES